MLDYILRLSLMTSIGINTRHDISRSRQKYTTPVIMVGIDIHLHTALFLIMMKIILDPRVMN